MRARHSGSRFAGAAARLLAVAWAIALGLLIGLAGWSRLATPVVVVGGSMAPSIPRGSIVDPDPVAPGDIAVGDIVTVRAANGTLVTHRVTRVAEIQGGTHLELRGDANAAPDPVLVPATSVVGRVDTYIPVVGYLLAMLTSLLGLVSVIGLMAAGLLGIWLLEDVASATAPARRGRAVEASHVAR